ncbi:MAG: hypothetical protein ACI9N9_002311 [Enterobacterales bacterium]|jgi:hypothetical protein
MIGGNSVLPTVCAIAWMAEAAESVFKGYKYQGLENYKLFKGVVFNGSETAEYQIDLELIDDSSNEDPLINEKTDTDYLRLESKVSSINPRGKSVFHYGSELILKRSSKKEALKISDLVVSYDNDASDIDKGIKEASSLYNNGTLFHGESLQGIKEIIRCDDDGLLLACLVPQIAVSKQGDFPLASHNIFANDLVYQAMLVWVRKRLSMGSLPSSTKGWTTYRQVQVDELFYLQLNVVAKSASKFIADISLINADNKILAEIKSAEVTLSANLNNLFNSAESNQSQSTNLQGSNPKTIDSKTVGL